MGYQFNDAISATPAASARTRQIMASRATRLGRAMLDLPRILRAVRYGSRNTESDDESRLGSASDDEEAVRDTAADLLAPASVPGPIRLADEGDTTGRDPATEPRWLGIAIESPANDEAAPVLAELVPSDADSYGAAQEHPPQLTGVLPPSISQAVAVLAAAQEENLVDTEELLQLLASRGG